jgi:prepilin-type N-terminal cleavage/methylation domain-containing protein
MKKKGFTLIELLVVIAIIAMLLAILMPALNKVKRLAQRLICGTNVKGIGTAMQVYANDYMDEFPMQFPNADPDHFWSPVGATGQFWNPDKDWSTGGNITVSASLYLLVRVADVDPKSFICRSGDQTAFEGVGGTAEIDLVEVWDFGGWDVDTSIDEGTVFYEDKSPRHHQSYAYQLPYPYPQQEQPARPADSTSGANVAVLADKNPWMDPKLDYVATSPNLQRDFMTFVHYICPDVTDWPIDSSSAWEVQIANSQPHGREGQSVLFGDGHADFEKRSDCSYQNDNIYTKWYPAESDPVIKKRRGNNRPNSDPDPLPDESENQSFSRTDEDTLLVNDDSRDHTRWD